jgi:hypothetical protein
MVQIKKQYVANAFISCSLRAEDKSFVDFVGKILKIHNIRPFGTVGKYSVSPENPVELMKKNIPLADLVVICATPRYLQMDLHNGDISYGLPEMVHVETGMAYMANKPVVVFVKEGTNVGSFIPNITQYITLTGDYNDFKSKKRQVFSLLNNTYKVIKKIENNRDLRMLGKIILWSLAIYGGFKIVKEFIKK